MSHARFVGCTAFFASLMLTHCLPAQQDLPPGSRIRPLPLLVSESIQKEIELTDEQKVKAVALHDDFQKAATKLRAAISEGNKDLRDLSDEQRTKFFQGIRKINDDFEPKTREILKPEQYERAQQIAYQVQRSGAFRNPDVIKSLELTAEQQEKIVAAAKEYLERYRAAAANDTTGAPEKSARLVKLSEDHMAELVKLLTKEQNEKWMALRGKPFDISTIYPVGRPKPDEKKP